MSTNIACGRACVLRAFGLCGSAPAPTRQIYNYSAAPLFYMLLRSSLAPLLGAPPMSGAFGRGPPPRPQSLGGSPAPLSLHPAPVGRAPPRLSGLRVIGCRAPPSAFLSAGAGNQNGAYSLLLGVPLCVPLRPLRVRRAILVSRSRTDKAIFQNSRHCWNLFSPPRPYSNNVGNFKKPTATKYMLIRCCRWGLSAPLNTPPECFSWL